MLKLKDRTFIITGGTNDVGRALTLTLASLGADIAILDKNPEKARRIVDEIAEARERNESSGKAAYIEVNLTTMEGAKEAVSKAAETFGGVDVLISGLSTSKVSQITSPEYLADFERLIDINTRSSVFTTQAVLPFL
jgi:citronellol/citronellal dehydrogenase